MTEVESPEAVVLAVLDGAPRNVSKPGWVSHSYLYRMLSVGSGSSCGSAWNIALANLCAQHVLSWSGGHLGETPDGKPYAAALHYHRNTPLEILAMQAPKGPKKPTHKAARRMALENAVLEALAYYAKAYAVFGRHNQAETALRQPLFDVPADFTRRSMIEAYVTNLLSEPHKKAPKEQSLEARLNRTISELKKLGIIEERAVRLGPIALGVASAFEFYYRKRSTLEMLAAQVAP